MRMLTNEEFIKKAINIHGNTYDYSLTKYTGNKAIIKIICRKHGICNIVADKHLHRKQGCLICSFENRTSSKPLTTEIFIDRAIKIYGIQYDYSYVSYYNAKTKVEILCKNHGKFFITPSDHINNKRGCKKCGIRRRTVKRRLTKEEFIEKAHKIHNNIYDYCYIKYKNSKTKIKINCSIHNFFWKIAGDHLSGQGCPKCFSSRQYSKIQLEWIAFLKYKYPHIQYCMSEDGEYQIDKYKCDGFDLESKTVFEFHGDFWHGNPKIHNPQDINRVTKTTFQELYDKTLEKRHYIESLGYNYIEIWESEWKAFKNIISKLQLKYKNN